MRVSAQVLSRETISDDQSAQAQAREEITKDGKEPSKRSRWNNSQHSYGAGIAGALEITADFLKVLGKNYQSKILYPEKFFSKNEGKP